MNPIVKFKEYDQVYDIIQIMVFTLNSYDELTGRHMMLGSRETDLQWLNYLMASIGFDIDDRLKIFCDVTMYDVSFIMKYYEKNRKEQDFLDLKKFLALMKSDVEFKNQIIYYYLKKRYNDEKSVLYDLTFNCNKEFSSTLREQLIGFVLFTDEIFKQLIYIMERLGKYLEKLYIQNKLLLEKLKRNFSVKQIANIKMENVQWLLKQPYIEISFSVIDRYVILCEKQNKIGRMILGIEYNKKVEAMWNSDISVIDIFNSLGDEIRYKILNLLKKKHLRMSVREIAECLELPIPTVIYHVDKLKKVKMLTSKMRGKTVIYQINMMCIENIIKELKGLV